MLMYGMVYLKQANKLLLSAGEGSVKVNNFFAAYRPIFEVYKTNRL